MKYLLPQGQERVCVCVWEGEGVRGGGGASAWGGGICCALWEMGVEIRHSCCMTFCSVQFPHRSQRKQRRVTQCCYSTLISCELQEKDCTVFQGVCTWTMNIQDIKDVCFSTEHFPRSVRLEQSAPPLPHCAVLSLCACMHVHVLSEEHSLMHSACLNDYICHPQWCPVCWVCSDARVLTEWGWAEDSPEIEVFHENIRMENHFTVKASFINALEEPRPVCSIWAPFLP